MDDDDEVQKLFSAFQLSYQKKKFFRMLTGCQKDRKTCQQTVGQIDRKTDRKTDRLFSLVIKTKVVQNVNRMSESQSDRKIYIAPGRQTE